MNTADILPPASDTLMSNDPLRHVGYITLPSHTGKGGFDHAAAHAASGHVYVAHTANDAVDVFDPASGKHLFSIPGLPGVAGVLVSDESQLIIASARAENTIGVFAPGPNPQVRKVAVGLRPNGLAYDPKRGLILVANVGDPAVPGSYTLSMVDLEARRMRTAIPVAGRTRWALYDPEADAFYVNISDPPQIVIVDARDPQRVARVFAIPAAGPHGLDLDVGTHRLFCACDAKTLVALDADSGRIMSQQPLSGVPDVVFFNRQRQQLYVAIGDPGVIDVFDTATMERVGGVTTEKGAHTTALAPAGDRVYAFLPATHRVAVYQVS
ncbi:MAG TPA: YncE family protein [Alphaproteobacteria bacterium]